MKSIKLTIVLSILLMPALSAFGQLLETKQIIGISAGYGSLIGADDNLFFPSSVDQSGINIDVSYSQKINAWLDGGLAIGFDQYSSPSKSAGFAQVISDGSLFITAGPQFTAHSAFKNVGVFNWLRLGIGLSPQYILYSGERHLLVNNEVHSITEGGMVEPILEMNDNSSGFGAKISPEINYRITQRMGIKMAYNLQLMNVYTGYERETLLSHSFAVGFIITFGNSKQLF